MYIGIGIFLLICFLFLLLCHFKKKHIIKRIQEICECEKIALLNDLITPSGFYYDPEENIFSSTKDAWQRSFGYSALYDETAPLAQIVFDCLPIYFDYDGKTWLIELWKGQYGINTGAELGIYQADTVLSPKQYRTTLFHTIPDEELPFLQLELTRNKTTLFRIRDRHWWLTGFYMGNFSQPKELEANGSITFSSSKMMEAFLNALYQQMPCPCDIKTCDQTVTFPLNASTCSSSPNKENSTCSLSRNKKHSSCSPCQRRPLRCRISQWKNRLFVRIYCRFTSPFENTVDKLLYLYYFLPAVFRRMIQPRKKKCYRKYKKYKRQKKQRDKKTHDL